VRQSSKRGNPRRKSTVRQVQLDPPQKQWRRRLLNTAKWTGAVFTVVAFVSGVWGPPWPTEPSFSPNTASFGSALDVPFIVENKSSLFALSNLRIICHPVSLVARGPTGAEITIGDNVTIGPPPARAMVINALPPMTSTSFACPIRGAIVVDGKDAADRTIKARLSFISEYDSRLFWGRSRTESGVFSLDTATIPQQWVPWVPIK
jgi:hypothetical protein